MIEASLWGHLVLRGSSKLGVGREFDVQSLQRKCAQKVYPRISRERDARRSSYPGCVLRGTRLPIFQRVIALFLVPHSFHIHKPPGLELLEEPSAYWAPEMASSAPLEVLDQIFSQLSLPSLKSVALVCRSSSYAADRFKFREVLLLHNSQSYDKLQKSLDIRASGIT